jgi:hypothetical protein
MSKPASKGAISLSAISLDLRSAAGEAPEGYMRLAVNAISDREGRLRRLGGWRALSLGMSSNRINEDLHDQLITNTVAPVVSFTLPIIRVSSPTIEPKLPATSQTGPWTVTVSAPAMNAFIPVKVGLPTVSVTGFSVST